MNVDKKTLLFQTADIMISEEFRTEVGTYFTQPRRWLSWESAKLCTA